jgi:hypothetical protein
MMKKYERLTNEYIASFIGPYLLSESSILFPVMLRPKSCGYIRSRSTDPFEHPIIDPKYQSPG